MPRRFCTPGLPRGLPVAVRGATAYRRRQAGSGAGCPRSRGLSTGRVAVWGSDARLRGSERDRPQRPQVYGRRPRHGPKGGDGALSRSGSATFSIRRWPPPSVHKAADPGAGAGQTKGAFAYVFMSRYAGSHGWSARSRAGAADHSPDRGWSRRHRSPPTGRLAYEVTGLGYRRLAEQKVDRGSPVRDLVENRSPCSRWRFGWSRARLGC